MHALPLRHTQICLMHTKEHFECANCFHKWPLDIHGGCEHCHSQAVMSLAVISMESIGNISKSMPRTISA
jgi:hypothetical protein